MKNGLIDSRFLLAPSGSRVVKRSCLSSCPGLPSLCTSVGRVAKRARSSRWESEPDLAWLCRRLTRATFYHRTSCFRQVHATCLPHKCIATRVSGHDLLDNINCLSSADESAPHARGNSLVSVSLLAIENVSKENGGAHTFVPKAKGTPSGS